MMAGAIALLVIPREKLISSVTPEVHYVTVTNAKISDSIATMDVQLEVTSKLLPVFVDSLVYDFRLFGQSVANGNQKFTSDSKEGKLQKLAIPVAIEPKKARELVKRQVAEGEKLQAYVEAYCRLPVVGIRRIAINREVDMLIPVPGTEIITLQQKPK
jgi:hypothetical protein